MHHVLDITLLSSGEKTFPLHKLAKMNNSRLLVKKAIFSRTFKNLVLRKLRHALGTRLLSSDLQDTVAKSWTQLTLCSCSCSNYPSGEWQLSLAKDGLDGSFHQVILFPSSVLGSFCSSPTSVLENSQGGSMHQRDTRARQGWLGPDVCLLHSLLGERKQVSKG
jgi:hypothetical protein